MHSTPSKPIFPTDDESASTGAQVLALKSGVNAPTAGIEQLIDASLRTYFETLGSTLPAPGLYERVLAQLERPLIVHMLRATHGNQIRAAEILGINRNTLRKKMRLLGINSKAAWKHAA